MSFHVLDEDEDGLWLTRHVRRAVAWGCDWLAGGGDVEYPIPGWFVFEGTEI